MRTLILALVPLLAAPLAALPAPAPQAGTLPPLKSQVIAQDLDYPVFVASPPGDAARLFIVEQTGRIRIHEAGTVLATPFLDLSAMVQCCGEAGLLGLAFHPDYAQNGFFYVFYNDLTGDTNLARYTASPPEGSVADPLSAQLLLTIDKPFSKHNGGMLAFGPADGMLYVSIGDGGGDHDPFGSAQALDSLFGKILRLDVDSATPYAIPPDNPFVGVAGAREEIYALGMRNPWRFGFDRTTGSMFVGDVGGVEREELNHVPPGGGQNFGWDCEEGAVCADQPGCNPCPAAGFTPSLHEYDHNEGCVILGGPAYRGTALPGLDGRVFFADHCTGRVWSMAFDGTAATDLVEHSAELSPPGGLGLLTSFGEDAAGELYITSFFPGTLRKIVSADAFPDCDSDGVPDADEILQGTAFDVNANAIPDSCELLLTATDFVTGQQGVIEFIGAAPADPVAIVWTTRGIGEGPCFFEGAWCLSLLPMPTPGMPIGILGVALAGPDGSMTATFMVPDFTGPKLVALQAVVILFATSKVSNPVQKVIL